MYTAQRTSYLESLFKFQAKTLRIKEHTSYQITANASNWLVILNDCIDEVDHAVVGQDVGDDDRRLTTSAVQNQSGLQKKSF